MNIIKKSGRNFSTFRTFNNILNYCEVANVQDIVEAFKYAKERKLNTYILGGGSNTFFENSTITSLVIKNKIDNEFSDLGDGNFYFSSSVRIQKILNFAYEKQLDAPYYLASLPAEFGGILAMNAGRGGRGGSIYNYVVSVRCADSYGNVYEKKPEELDIHYRHTFFLDNPNFFILGATLNLKSAPKFEKNPIVERIEFSKRHQDLSAPNIGCFYGPYCNKFILYICWKIFRVGKARFSPKEKLWLLNSSENPKYLRRLTHFVRFLHGLLLSEYKPEARVVK